MLENNGNPFIRNKKGETIDYYLQKESCDAIIYQKLKMMLEYHNIKVPDNYGVILLKELI